MSKSLYTSMGSVWAAPGRPPLRVRSRLLLRAVRPAMHQVGVQQLGSVLRLRAMVMAVC